MPATESKQLRILRRLMDHMGGIDPENLDPNTGAPYEISLKDNVFIGKLVFGSEISYPALSMLEKPVPEDGIPADELKTIRLENWTLLLQGFVEDGEPHTTEPAYALKAQVEQRLSQIVATDGEGDPKFPDVFLLGGLIAGMTIGQGVVRPPTQNVSATAFFYLPVVIKMKTDVTNPYAD